MKNRSEEEHEEANGTFVLLSDIEWHDFQEKDRLKIPDRHKTHFGKVLRKTGKYPLQICNGRGDTCLALAEAAHYTKTTPVVSHPERFRKITLVQAELKNKAMSVLLQKVTELGISQVILFHSDHCQNRSSEISRFEAILENACMQSKNVFLPQIHISREKTANLDFSDFQKIWWGDIQGNPADKLSTDIQKPAFINGPEGGWSEPEKKWLKNNFPCVSLSENVLRAETAAICAAFWLGF